MQYPNNVSSRNQKGGNGKEEMTKELMQDDFQNGRTRISRLRASTEYSPHEWKNIHARGGEGGETP